jgi:predicted outer membrane repeat protein
MGVGSVRRRVAAGLAGLALAAGSLIAIGMAPAGAATTITVTSSADTGGTCPTFPTGCTLRQAFVAASTGGAAAGSDVVIVIQAGLVITLGGTLGYDGGSGGNHAMTIQGNGATVEGNSTFGQIDITSSGLLTIDGLTLAKGNSALGAGGAISASGAVTVTNSTFTTNTADDNGGAIAANGAVKVTNSTFTTNTAGENGGAIAASGAVKVTNSTFTTNTAGENGGAIAAIGAVTVTTSTFTTNTAALGAGGAIAAVDAVTLAYSTLTGNVGPDGSAVQSSSSIALFGSVFVKPGATGLLCSGPSTSLGYNFVNETANSCGLTATGDSSLDANDPLLGGLAANGGPTQTQLPQTGSPLIDAIPSAACQMAPLASGITSDQRGLPRPDAASPNCDIGAVEVQPARASVAPTLTVAFTG